MINNKYLSNEDKKLYRVLEKQIDGIYDIFESTTFITSVYLLKYLSDGDIKYYNLFIEKMSNLNLEERRQVFINVLSNLKEQQKNKKENNKHNKVRVKK